MKNDKNLNPELAELIGAMIYELHQMYQAFLEKQSLDDSIKLTLESDDLTQSKLSDDIPW